MVCCSLGAMLPRRLPPLPLLLFLPLLLASIWDNAVGGVLALSPDQHPPSAEHVPANTRVPTRRFGRTGIDMPVFTMGGMRTQQSWGRGGAADITSMSQVDEECQANFVRILERALELGVNHFETARGYGCSELQYGDALKLLFANGTKREDIILQTKVSPFATPDEFRETLDLSLSLLGVDYIDLFAFHGINTETKLEWTMRSGGCMEVAREYQRAGKLRWIGFSTHAMTPLIIKAIETDAFDYVNLHYHFIGSYTSTGSGPGGGNFPAIEAATKHDMGVFIISPNDKGGMLYKPPQKLADATAPLTPMAFHNLWLLEFKQIHTMVVGAARPSDFDEHLESLKYYDEELARKGRENELVSRTAARLHIMEENATKSMFTNDWDQHEISGASAPWWRGVPDIYGNIDGHCGSATETAESCATASTEAFGEHNNPRATGFLAAIWCWRLVKSYDLLEFCRERIYAGLVKNGEKWNASEGADYSSNVAAMNDWGPGTDLGDTTEDDWKAVFATSGIPEARQQHLIAVLHEARELLKPDSTHPLPPHASDQPDIPWPEREASSEKGAAATVVLVIAVALLMVSCLSQQQIGNERSNEKANTTVAKRIVNKRDKQQPRRRSSSPSVSPGAVPKEWSGGGTRKTRKAKKS